MSTYVEDSSLTLPALEDGPLKIGALWNCHDSTFIHGCNLFDQIRGEHLKVNPINNADYMLRHVKSTSDKQKILNVKGELSIELFFFITIKSSAEYTKVDCSSLSEEEILCTYDLTTSSVETLPSIAETINPLVQENILKGDVKATHVVVGVKYGAKVVASIRVKETNFKSRDKMSGFFLGKVVVGVVSEAAKAALGMLDSQAKNSFQSTIKITSRPPINSKPRTIKEMFEVVSSIHEVVEGSIGLQLDTHTVYGVPMMYSLVPINQFIQVDIEKLYLHFKDAMLDKLNDYLAFLMDFQVYPYMLKKALEAEPDLKIILHDPQNPLTHSAIESENEYKSTAKKYLEELGNFLKEYKVGKTDAESILQAINEMEELISTSIIAQKVDDLVHEGKSLLNKVNYADFEEYQKVEFFTNEGALERWYEGSKPSKILIRTAHGDISSSALATTYKLSSKLSDIGIEVGVALPNVSMDQNSLALKVNGIEVLYGNEQIEHVVQVLQLLVCEAKEIATRFFTIYASSEGVKLPFHENLEDLHRLISILEETRTVKIAESFLQTRDLCFKDNGKMKFVINLQCLDSAIESVTKLKYFRDVLADHGDWIVGQWTYEEIQDFNDSPLLFVFQNEELFAVCCDNLDAFLLRQYLEATEIDKESCIAFLQPTEENLDRNTFNRQRAQFALNFASKLQTRSSVFDDIPALQDIPGFEKPEVDATHQWTQKLIRSVLAKHWPSVYVSLAADIANESEEAETALRNVLDSVADDFEIEKLVVVLLSLLEDRNPFYGLVGGTIEEIKAVDDEAEDSQMDVLQKFAYGVINHEQCPEILAEQLRALQDVTNYSDRAKETIKRLENHMTVSGLDPKLEKIVRLMQLMKSTSGTARESIVTSSILPRALSEIQIQDSEYPGANAHLQMCIKSHNFYGALHLLTSVQMNPSLYIIQVVLENLSVDDYHSGLSTIMDKLAKVNFSNDQFRSIFRNQKIGLLLQTADQSFELVEKIKVGFWTRGKQHVLPDFLRELIERLLDAKEEEDFGTFMNFDDTACRFERFAKREELPENFTQVLTESLLNNVELKEKLQQCEALVHWDDSECQFTEAWECGTVKTAYDKLVEWKRMQDRLD